MTKLSPPPHTHTKTLIKRRLGRDKLGPKIIDPKNANLDPPHVPLPKSCPRKVGACSLPMGFAPPRYVGISARWIQGQVRWVLCLQLAFDKNCVVGCSWFLKNTQHELLLLGMWELVAGHPGRQSYPSEKQIWLFSSPLSTTEKTLLTPHLPRGVFRCLHVTLLSSLLSDMPAICAAPQVCGPRLALHPQPSFLPAASLPETHFSALAVQFPPVH